MWDVSKSESIWLSVSLKFVWLFHSKLHYILVSRRHIEQATTAKNPEEFSKSPGPDAYLLPLISKHLPDPEMSAFVKEAKFLFKLAECTVALC